MEKQPGSEKLRRRYAGKGLISCDDNERYVFVAGRRGMWNLPGGGLDPGESYKDAFLREADEEIENFSSMMTDPVEVCRVKGIVTPANRSREMAYWKVFRASLLVPHALLSIAEDSDITGITAFTREECLTHNNMSELAKEAIRLVSLEVTT